MASLSELLDVPKQTLQQMNVMVAMIKAGTASRFPAAKPEEIRRICTQQIATGLMEAFDNNFPEEKSVTFFRIADDLNILTGLIHGYSASAAGLSADDVKVAVAHNAIRMTDLAISTKKRIDRVMTEPEDKTREEARREVAELFWSSISNPNKE